MTDEMETPSDVLGTGRGLPLGWLWQTPAANAVEAPWLAVQQLAPGEEWVVPMVQGPTREAVEKRVSRLTLDPTAELGRVVAWLAPKYIPSMGPDVVAELAAEYEEDFANAADAWSRAVAETEGAEG